MRVKALFLGLVVFILIMTGCEDGTTTPIDNSGGITWTLEQSGGSPAGESTPAKSSTGIIIKFSEMVMVLQSNEVTVSGSAIFDTSRGLSFSGNNWTIPVIVTDAGNATVNINKAGVARGPKDVALYKDISLIVTFNKNNTDPESTEANPRTKSVLLPGDKIGALPEEPSRIGYTFAGWKDADNSDFDENTPVTKNITVFAQWNIKQYTLTYNTNGATSGAAPSAVTEDYNTVIKLHDGTGFSKTNFGFSGWNTQPDGKGTKYNAGASFTVKENIELFADWQPLYTVTFNINGATSGDTPPMVTQPAGTIITLPAGTGLLKTGFNFAGWNTQSDGKGTNYNAGASYTVTAAVTLFAHWQPLYTVTFDINGAIGADPAPITRLMNTVITLPSGNGLSMAGLDFGGWNTKPDGKGITYFAGASFTVTENITLFAYWQSSIFTEVFDKLHIANPIFGTATAYGDPNVPNVPIKGSVIYHMFENLVINQQIPEIDSNANPEFKGKLVESIENLRPNSAGNTPVNNVTGWNTTRPGAKREIKYIIYHDTANTGPVYNGDAKAHADLISNYYGTSWHYTVDYLTIYQSIPDDEIAWHAGNAIGNLYGIGIETCINYGVIKSDFYQTWQRMGKLTASLLDKHNLTMADVLSHKEISKIGYDTMWSGTSTRLASFIKCCPRTLRHADLYSMAKRMIEYELLYLQKVKNQGYTFELTVDLASAEFIDNKGRVIKLPAAQREVYYTLKVTDSGNNVTEKTYVSVLPAQGTNYAISGYCDIGGPCQ